MTEQIPAEITDLVGPADDPAVLRRAQELLDREWRLLYGGRLEAAAGQRTFDSISPWSEQVLAQVPDADASDAARAAQAAADASEEWGALPMPERIRLVQNLADVLEDRMEDFAVLDAIDSGSPIEFTRRDARGAVDSIRRFAGIAPQLHGSTIPASGDLHMTVREPYGIALRIVAYNHPFMFAATRMAAPLLAGNAVIVKPSELAPLSALYMGEVLREHLPPGVLSVMVGRGAELPRALVRDRRIGRIGFIGSTATGLAVQRDAAGDTIKDVTLELGGKNALIAYPDCDPDQVARAAVEGMNFTWAGQSCMSTSRLLVHEDIADQVVARVTRIARERIARPPLDSRSEQGTVISRAQHDRIRAMIDTATEEGAELVTGGERPAHLDQGLFIAPTVLDHVALDATIARQEVFGPVLSVVRWNDEDDPIAMANAVDYGLTANVWTRDISRAHAAARRLKVGYVWINGWPRLFPGVPFGGVKNSGLGREDGLEELESYTTLKAVNVIFEQESK